MNRGIRIVVCFRWGGRRGGWGIIGEKKKRMKGGERYKTFIEFVLTAPFSFESRIEAKPVFLKMFSKTRIFKELYNEVEVAPNVNDVKANKEKKVRTASDEYDVKFANDYNLSKHGNPKFLLLSPLVTV